MISIIINAHNEGKWLKRAVDSVLKQQNAPPRNIHIVCDNADEATLGVARKFREVAIIHEVKFGDLGLSRNFGVEKATGKYVAFLDGDDLFGCDWLRKAYDAAEKTEGDFVLHQEWSVFFGAEGFAHHHVGSDHPSFDARDMVQFNPWNALCFAPRQVFVGTPYIAVDDRFGYEDYRFYGETMGKNIPHLVVPNTCYFVRAKKDLRSMAHRFTAQSLAMARLPLLDRRDLKQPIQAPQPVPITQDVLRQSLYAHNVVGEWQIVISSETKSRVYPRTTEFADMAFLRDAIGDATHVILVEQLTQGGAERYALNAALALKAAGKKVVVVETNPNHAAIGGLLGEACRQVEVVRWFRRAQMDERADHSALQHALIQADLESVFVCNSVMGWQLIGENPKCLATKVVAASFATIPREGGFWHCPPFWIDKPGFTILTDNKRHAGKLLDYGTHKVVVVHPKGAATKSKLRQTHDTNRRRILWAGRGTFDKRPEMAAFLASAMPEYDFHVWGDVQQVPHALPNLFYRGPFDGFDSIDGAYDAFLLTSMNEGMPHAALEAVLAGLPVASTDVGDLSMVAAVSPVASHKPMRDQVLGLADAVRSAIDMREPKGAALVNNWMASFDADIVEVLQ